MAYRQYGVWGRPGLRNLFGLDPSRPLWTQILSIIGQFAIIFGGPSIALVTINYYLSLPKTRFVHIDDGAHQGSGVQQHLRTARSRVCRARPSRAKREFARHYNRRRISREFAEGALH